MKSRDEAIRKLGLANLVNANFAVRKDTVRPILSSYAANDDGGNEDLRTMVFESTVGSIAALQFLNTVPEDNGDSYHQAIGITYNAIRQAQSGRINYTVNTFEKYVWNLTQLHTLYAYGLRAVRCLDLVDAFTAQSPVQVIRACGFDYEDLRDNCAQFSAYLRKAREILVNRFPLKLPIFEWKSYLFGHVFKDMNAKKAQWYIPRLGPSLSYCTFDGEGNGAIQEAQINLVENYMTTSQFTRAFEEILDYMAVESRFAAIPGEIIRAFGPNSYYDASYWEPDASGLLVHDKGFLEMLQNAGLGGPEGFTGDGTGSGDTVTLSYDSLGRLQNAIVARVGQIPYQATMDQAILNVEGDKPTSEDVLNAFTWQYHCDTPVLRGQELFSGIDTCGSEILECIIIETLDPTGRPRAFVIRNGLTLNGATGLESVARWAQFDWFPAITRGYMNVADGVTQNPTFDYIFDAANFGYADFSIVDTAHGITALAMWTKWVSDTTTNKKQFARESSGKNKDKGKKKDDQKDPK